MSQRGGTGKMRDFVEKKVHVIVSRIGDKGVVYKVKQEDEGNSKIRVLQRNVIMKIDDTLDNFDWNVSISEKETAKSDEEYPLQFAPVIFTCYLEVVKIMQKV